MATTKKKNSTKKASSKTAKKKVATKTTGKKAIGKKAAKKKAARRKAMSGIRRAASQKVAAKKPAKKVAKKAVKKAKKSSINETVSESSPLRIIPRKKNTKKKKPIMRSTVKTSLKVGDIAVYPAHGVGQIERVENKEISGSILTFYVMRILDSDMTVMIPKLIPAAIA